MSRSVVAACLIGITSAMTGCQSIQLENHTVRQSRTLTDLQYKLVLDNLAMVQTNPGAMPFFSAVGAGLTSIQQSATASFTPGVDLLLTPHKVYRYFADKFGYNIGGTQTNNEQWNTAAVLNPDELALMRCVYQRTLGYTGQKCEANIQSFFAGKPELVDAMQTGWLCVGQDGEKPPKNAAYVGFYRHQYVWVLPDAVDPLTRLTLAILDVATATPPNAAFPTTDPKAAKLKALQDQATSLEALYDKYPGKDTSPIAKLIKDQIDLVVPQILILEGKTKQEIITAMTSGKANVIPMGPLEPLPSTIDATTATRLLDRAQAQLDTMAPMIETGGQGGWRARKNLYNPTIIPAGSSFP